MWRRQGDDIKLDICMAFHSPKQPTRRNALHPHGYHVRACGTVIIKFVHNELKNAIP